MMDLNKLAETAHEISRSKGWYETSRTKGEFFMLMVSEIAEASEEVRSNKPLVYQMVEDDFGQRSLGHPDWDFKKKPEGELVELADCLIRIADYAAFSKLNLAAGYDSAQKHFFDLSEGFSKLPKLEQHLVLVSTLCDAMPESYSNEEVETLLGGVVWFINEIYSLRAAAAPQDLESVTYMKMEYNKSRPHRHGGKLV